MCLISHKARCISEEVNKVGGYRFLALRTQDLKEYADLEELVVLIL